MNSRAIELFFKQHTTAQGGVYEIDGRRVAFLTDRCVMVVEDLDAGTLAPEFPPAQIGAVFAIDEAAVRTALGWGEKSEPQPVDAKQFGAFVGSPDWSRAKMRDKVCQACEGDGDVICSCPTCDTEHVADCSKCDGLGPSLPEHEKRMGVIAGVPFDRNLLAQAIAAAGGLRAKTRATYRIEKRSNGFRLIRIDFGRVRVLLMQTYSSSLQGMPVFGAAELEVTRHV